MSRSTAALKGAGNARFVRQQPSPPEERSNAAIDSPWSIGPPQTSVPMLARKLRPSSLFPSVASIGNYDPASIYLKVLSGTYPASISYEQSPSISQFIYQLPLSTPVDDTATRFNRLVAEWKAAKNEFASDNSNMVLPAYQQIIGLGPDAVNLILAELEESLDDWFWALRAITGEDPVPDDHLGDFEAMREDWFLWAESNGYRWRD